MLELLLQILALLSIGLTLWQWLAARRFPIHQRVSAPAAAPSFTVFKPLKGAGSQTHTCLESWFVQDYSAQIQILLGVASLDDPACAVARDLIQAHPEINAELILCQPLLGPNAKVSTLCHLLKRASHEHVIVSDDDVLVSRDFLRNVGAEFTRADTGLVNCFYMLSAGERFGSQWEAVAVNADFWSQVLQGLTIRPMDFALGAVMATTRSQIQRIGGFESLLEYLADDYQLGNRVVKTGARLVLCPVPVECRSDPLTFQQAWSHQLRWARTIRICQPVPYFLSVLSNATIWPLAYFALSRTSSAASTILIAALLLRGATALHNYRALTTQRVWFPFCFAWIKDLLHMIVWALAFLGNTVTWRGERFHVSRGGKLTRL